MDHEPEEPPGSRLADLLAEALERAPEDRETFLAQACPDDTALRAEVLSLAAQETEAGNFMEQPAYVHADAADPFQGELKPGDVLGDCKVRRLVGEGGMGEVYLADDTRLERPVAVKLLKRHLNDVLRDRFQHERRVLAGLTHPGIARLYNAAVSEGRAFLVMEYVEGDRLDEYCDARRLSVEERLALFRKVCAAVAYAHQHLVIHRDLKPANIRVTPEGEPKLLDFGIAKLVDPQSDHDTAQTVTQFGALTPGYASPEQLRGEPVTTATDIYSLGVVLYELLCGQRPFDPNNRLARTENIPRPGSVAPSAAAAEARGTTPGRLMRRLAGDLDNIVLMALRPEPARRYAYVSQFSEDIRRSLEGQPVAARKETLRYVGAKFVSRNKALTTAALLGLLTLVGGMVATAWQAHRADDQRRRADRRFDDVRGLAHSLMFEIHDSVETLAGSTPTRRLIVTRALEYLDRLSKDADAPALRLDLATAYEKIGDVQGNPYSANLGDTDGAQASYRKAEGLMKSLTATGTASPPEVRMELGRVYRALGDIAEVKGRFAEMLREYRQSLDVYAQLAREKPSDPAVLDELARAYATLADGLDRTEDGRTEQVRCFEKALEYSQQLAAQTPGKAKYRRSVAVDLMKLGRVVLPDKARALDYGTRSVAMMKSLLDENPDNARVRRDYAVTLFELSQTQAETGEYAECLVNLQKLLAIREQTAASDPKNEQAQLDLAVAHADMAEALVHTGQPESALDHAGRAIASQEAVIVADPDNTSNVRGCGLSYKRAGSAHATLGARETLGTPARLAHWADARSAYEKARKLFSGLKEKGIVRNEDSDMLDKLTGLIAECDQAMARLKP